jgi:hypothetical protein
MQIIEISSVTGHSPYDIIICDITNTYCYTVETGVASVPPYLYINIPSQLNGVNSLLIKIIDSSGCETFQYAACPPTPTPTPTNSMTPTPTPTNANCVCLIFNNPTLTIKNYSYINCNGQTISYTLNSETEIFVCGKNPVYDSGVILTIGQYCSGNVCIPPTPTPTPSTVPAPIICFGIYTESTDTYYCSISYSGYYNGKPYYILLDTDCVTPLTLFVWWNSSLNRWELTDLLGGGTLYSYNENPSNYPETNNTYSWNIVIPSLSITSSSVGQCCICTIIEYLDEGSYTGTYLDCSGNTQNWFINEVGPPITYICTSNPQSITWTFVPLNVTSFGPCINGECVIPPTLP